MKSKQPPDDARTLDDAAEALGEQLAGDGTPSALRLAMRPHKLATPHAVLVGDRIDATIDLHDGQWLAGIPGSAAMQAAVAHWFDDWSDPLRACWVLATVVDDALRQLRAALHTLPFTPADEAQRDRLLDPPAVDDVPSLLAASRDPDGRVSPGFWGLTLALLIDLWRRRGEAPPVVEALPVLLQHFPVAADGDALVALCVDALFLLHWEVTGADDDDRDAVVAALRALAAVLRVDGHHALAAGLAIDASRLARRGSAAAAEAACEAIEAAQGAADAGLVAFARVSLASSLAAAGPADAALRARAFDAAEHALDALAGLEPALRAALAERLTAGLAHDEAFRPLQAIAAALTTAAPDPALWQPRVQHEPVEPWLVRIRALYADGSPWFAVDDARAALQPTVAATHASADWTHWTVDHPAYRRVIPHHRSFLRERDFDRNLLVLTHELTHVLCLLGGVGIALACLRTAGLAIELALWRAHAGPAPGAEPWQRLAQEGLAPLPPGRSAALAGVGHGLALHRKAQVLQAVWTPWFEGLAVFGETAADPLHDADVIDPVNDALRNLVDTPLGGDAAAVRAALLATIEEFQQRSAAALQREGAARLGDVFNQTDAPYWVGYLAVRAVVAAWRDTLACPHNPLACAPDPLAGPPGTPARPLSATQAFRALLHATRFDRDDMIPPLALGEAAFAQAAEQAMLQWVQRLAELGAGEIDLLVGAHAEATDHVGWTQGHPALSAAGGDAALAALLRDGVRQALEGIADPFARAGFTLDELARHANQTILLGSFLPIGHAEAPFHLTIDPDDGSGHLVLLLRTTEHHVDGGPSMNLHGVSLLPAAAQALAAEVARSGVTRIGVTRVIDLGGIAAPDLGIAGLHLLCLRCGGWFDVHGATNAVAAVLAAAPRRTADLQEMLRARLLPERAMRVEREIVASPEFAAVRAIEWLSASDAWDAPGASAQAVQAAAERILLHERVAPALWPLQPLAAVLLGDIDLAARLAASDFRALTRELPEHREALVTSLFRSAQAVRPDAVDAALALALQRNRITILHRRPAGWDVATRAGGAPPAAAP